MVHQDLWQRRASDNIFTEDFQISPLEAVYPEEDELTPEELRSPLSRVLWGVMLVVYLFAGGFWLYLLFRKLQLEVWMIWFVLYLFSGLFISVVVTTVLRSLHVKRLLDKKYAQRKRTNGREASIRTRYAREALYKLHKHNGYSTGRAFRLERSSQHLKKAFQNRRFLTFERDFRVLLKEYNNLIKRLIKYWEMEEVYEGLIKNRQRSPTGAATTTVGSKGFPLAPDFPLAEMLQVRADFEELINQIDHDPAFATIIIILKTANRQLDPAIVLRKLKKGHQA